MVKTLVLHVSHLFGGAERSLLEILANSCNRDRYVLVLNPETELYEKAVSAGYAVYSADIRYYSKKDLRSNFRQVLKNVSAVSAELRRIGRKEGVSVVYCNTHRSLIYTIPIGRSPCRVVCSCRDGIESLAERWLVRWLSDTVIAVSDYIANQLNQKNVHVVRNVVAPPKIRTPIDLRERFGLSSESICIGMVGSLTPWKNQKDFLRIAAALIQYRSDLHFFIVGETVDSLYRDELMRFVEQENMRSSVTFTGAVTTAIPWLSAFDLVVHTAINEPFGRVVAEAMYLRRPVIAYDCGGPSEILTHRETGILIRPYDIDAAVQEILALISAPHERTRLGQRAEAYAVKRWNIAEFVRTIEQFTLI